MKILPFLILCFSVIANAGSTFYEITDTKGNKHFIFGTFHSDDNRVTNFDPKIINAIKQSNLFLMETDELTDASVIQNLNIDIPAQLTDNELERLKDLINFHVMFYDQAIRMKPWLLAFIFDSPNPITPFNQDNLLKQIAEDAYIKTQGLMTNIEHFSVLDFLTTNEQIEILKNALKRPDNKKQENFEKLLVTYLDGDLIKIHEINEKITLDLMSPELWQKVKEKILIERNQVFNKKILEAMESHQIFVAIGASHLAGDDGLVGFLKQNGLTVQQVNF